MHYPSNSHHKKNEGWLRPTWVILSFIVTQSLFLAACASSPPTNALPTAIAVENTTTHEPTAIERPTPVQTIVATPLPATLSPTPLSTKEPDSQIYVVAEGDNLTIIANKFNTTVENIQRVNEIVDGNAVYVGQELEIPIDAVQADLFAEDTDDRGILHNQILCPNSEEIEELDLEGGTIIGRSAVCNIPITSYQFGQGDTNLVLVGGMHGGYEWNTILLAYSFLDHLQLNQAGIPASLNVVVIPNANPDGLFAVTQRLGRFSEDDVADNSDMGRFNGNFVDLNRNWDCEWAPTGLWRDNPVSGGSEPFSEPENQILRDFLLAKDPAATILIHSAATGIYVSGCGQVDPASRALATVYSQASGYPLYDTFQHYNITGDASNWLALQGIPAISVELSTHESIEWRANLAGLNALINYIDFQTAVD